MGIYEDIAALQSQMTQVQNDITALQTNIANMNYKAVPANSDLDDLTEGKYYITDYDTCFTIANRPDTTGQTATIEVLKAGASGQLIMIYRGCIKEYINIYMRVYYADSWGEWLKFDNDTGWINLTLNDGWSMNDYTTDKPQYRKVGNRVFLRGLVNATAAAGNIIATLPLGFRPTDNSFSRWRCPLNQIEAVNIQVGTNGNILDYSKNGASRAFIALSGITFLSN